MYTYLLLICFVIGIIYLNIKLYDNDYLSPSFLYSIATLLSLVCSFLGLFIWNDIKVLSLEAMMIIILSLSFFNIGEYVCRKKFNKNYKIKRFKNEIKDIPIWKSLLQLSFVVLVFTSVYFEVHRIASVVGYEGGIFSMINAYRSTSILFSTKYIETGVHINIIVAQLQKIADVVCFVNLYLLSCSLYKKKLFIDKKNIIYALIVLFCISMSLLIGSRIQTVIYVFFFIVVYVLNLHKKNSYKDILKKNWKYVAIFMVVGLGLFYIILPLSGRKTDADLLEYTTFYFGAPIPSMQKYLDSPKTEPSFFGEETFRGLQNVAYKLKISKFIQPITTKWTAFYTKDNDRLLSNIYTSAKRYYHDFGYFGIIVIQFINGFIFTLLYILMNKKKTNISIVFYAMFLYMVIDQVRDEYLFSTFVHINTLFKFVVLFCLLYFLEHSTDEMKELLINIKNRIEGIKNENKNR